MATTTSLGTSFTTASGTKTVTATPALNDLILIIVANSGKATATAPTDNNSDGLGTYTQVTSALKNSSADLLEVYVRNSLIGSASSTVFTMAPGTTTGGGLLVLKVTGMHRAGIAAIKQSQVQANQAAATPAPVLGGIPNTNDPVIGVVFNATNPATMTPRTGYTELSDLGYATPTTGIEDMHRDTGETSATITWGSASGSAFSDIVLELDAVTITEALSDSMSMSDKFVSTPPTLQLALSDNLNNWQDKALTFSAQWQIQIGCPHLNNWADAIALSLSTPLTEALSDSMSMSDAVATRLAIALNLSDTLSMSDLLVTAAAATLALYDFAEFLDQMGFGQTPFGESPFGGFLENPDQITNPYNFAHWNDRINIQLGGQMFLQAIDGLLSIAVLGVLAGTTTLVLTDNPAPQDVFGYEFNPTLLNLYDNASFYLKDLFAYSMSGGSSEIDEALADTLTLSDALSLGYGNLVSDQLSLSDAATLLFSLGMSVAETLTISDSQKLGYGFAIIDTLTLTDSFSLLNGLRETIAETLTLSDSQKLGYGLLISDAMSMSDADVVSELGGSFTFELLFLGVTIATGTAGSEAMTLTDAFTGLMSIAGTFTDQIVMSDANQLGYGAQISDSLSLSDATQFSFNLSISVAETLTVSDSQSLGYGLAIHDTLALSDALVGLLSIAGTFSDQLVQSDSNQLGYGDAITDSLSLTDSVSLTFRLSASFSETLSISDSQSLGYGFSITDTQALTDSFATLFSIAETLSDAMGLNEYLTLGYGSLLADSLTLSDTVQLLFALRATFSETLTVTDSQSLGYGFAIADSQSLSDSFNLSFLLTEKLSDSFTLSDSLSLLFNTALNVSESLNISDSPQLGYGLLIADAMTMVDAFVFSGFAGLQESLSDTLSMSDALALGYGEVNVDQITFVDSNNIGYGDLISDSLSLSDATLLAFGELLNLTETLSISDSNRLGYGFLIADSLSMSDAINISTNAPGLTEDLSDTLSLSDSLAVGYGNASVEQLFFLDSNSIGYGDLIADTLSMSDAFSISEIVGLNVAETMTLSDSNKLGYGLLIADQLVMSDSIALGFPLETENLTDTLSMSDALEAGYGNANVDQLVLVDAQGLGYGDLITDTMSLSDFVQLAFVLSASLADTFTITDSSKLGYGLTIAETLSMSDSLALGISEGLTDQLVFVDSQGLGYGDVLSDNLSNWQDAFQFSTGQPVIQLSLSDSSSMADTLCAGYGCNTMDQMTFTEAVKFIESFEAMIADATPTMLDALLTLIHSGLDLNDSLAFQEQLAVGYGFLIGVDQMTLVDSTFVNPVTTLFLALQDTETANWLEAIVLRFVFAPGVITLGMLSILQELVVNQIAVQGQLQVGEISSEPVNNGEVEVIV